MRLRGRESEREAIKKERGKETERWKGQGREREGRRKRGKGIDWKGRRRKGREKGE